MALLVEVFEATVGNAEFRRQVATPNVPRLAALLVPLAEKCLDEAVKVWLFPIPYPHPTPVVVYHHKW